MGRDPGERFEQLISSPPGLDSLYDIILEAFEREHSGVIVALLSWYLHAPRPLLFSTLLDHALMLLPPGNETTPLHTTIQVFCSVVGGSRSHMAVSCHVSFTTFLGDRSRSERFWVSAESTSVLGVERCLNVMSQYLRFNIANIPTSCIQTQDIPDIKQRIEAKIHPLLSYCCRSWPLPASIVLRGGAPIPSLASFLNYRTLEWIEVMSLIQCSPEVALAPLSNISVCISLVVPQFTKLTIR